MNDRVNPRFDSSISVGQESYGLMGRWLSTQPKPDSLPRTVTSIHLKGKRECASQLLEFIEKDKSLSREDVMAALHLYIMDVQNFMARNFEGEKPIHGVELFTDRYRTSQQEGFYDPIATTWQ